VLSTDDRSSGGGDALSVARLNTEPIISVSSGVTSVSFGATKEDSMALRDSMRESAATYLKPGEPVEAIMGAQTASNWLLPLTGFIFFRFINSYRIVAVTPQRIVVLDAGKSSVKKARGVVTELPRSVKLGPGSGAWHVVPVGQEKLRVHRRFFKDMEQADKAA
jgi:hypothetical protein